MAFALIVVGIVMLASAVNTVTVGGKSEPGSQQLVTLLKGDFTGQNNFIYWFVSILIIGALGYIEELRPISRAFLALVIVVLFLSKGGFFAKFNQQLGTTAQAAINQTESSTVGLQTQSPSLTTLISE